jgi:hypothetical protein
MKKPFYIFLTLISLFTLFFLNSCSNEDFANEGKNNLININQAREYFNNTPIKLKNNIYFSDELDWEKGHFENDTLAIPTLSMKPILIKKLKNEKTSKFLYPFLLITKNKTKNTYDYNLKVFISSSITAFNKNSYHLYDMNNKLILNKEKLAIYEPSKKTKRSRVECEEWGYFLINLETGQETLLYSWWECSGTNNEEEQAAPDGGDGGGGEAAIEQIIEEKIDDTKLDPCPKGIMDQLKNTTNNDIKSILEKFGAGNVYTIEMKMGDMIYPQDFAETQKISKNNYLITVTQDTYTSATKLYKATALLHETIHAYMLSVVDDYNTYPTNAPFNDFHNLFKLYVEKIYSSNAVAAQHEDMAKKYVDAIASSLEQYHVNTGLPSYTTDKQAFLDMAWSGLQGTALFIKNYPDGSIQRKRLDNRIIAEQIGADYGGQNVVGKPCN